VLALDESLDHRMLVGVQVLDEHAVGAGVRGELDELAQLEQVRRHGDDVEIDQRAAELAPRRAERPQAARHVAPTAALADALVGGGRAAVTDTEARDRPAAASASALRSSISVALVVIQTCTPAPARRAVKSTNRGWSAGSPRPKRNARWRVGNTGAR